MPVGRIMPNMLVAHAIAAWVAMFVVIEVQRWTGAGPKDWIALIVFAPMLVLMHLVRIGTAAAAHPKDVATWAQLGAALLTYAGAVVPIYRRRMAAAMREWRVEHNQCAVCAYDLTGNATGNCPECGTRIDEA